MYSDVFNSDFLRKLQNISLKIKMSAHSGNTGIRKSRDEGGSQEFSDFREYSPGDDLRKINWNAYGRSDRLLLKLFMEERESTVNIFLDTSKSMDFGEEKKSIRGLQLAAALTFISLKDSDRVCINTLGENGLYSSKELNSKNGFKYYTDFLQGIEFKGKTNINGCIKKKDKLLGGLSIIISDFFTADNLEESLKYLKYKKQDFMLIHILSPEELNPKLRGHLRLKDSETEIYRDITVTDNIIKKYDNALKEFTMNLNNISRKLGGRYIVVSSDESLEEIIFKKLWNYITGKF
ncbi:DUF58 domain-containing protein [Clostridium sp. KNHs214]|uniref:DUF58 domain-containing protein n=1 Tax=Clostridium sp. KNHs214 TaxID=1540257 RepID=UPI000555F9DC|nr:DUF58 domain-containing protein [Clostridium sp. KNHs214]